MFPTQKHTVQIVSLILKPPKLPQRDVLTCEIMNEGSSKFTRKKRGANDTLTKQFT